MTKEQYESLSLMVLRDLAKTRGLKSVTALRKGDLIEAMLREDDRLAALGESTAPKKPAEKTAEKPAEKPIEKSEKLQEKPAEKTPARAQEKAPEKPAEKPVPKQIREKPEGEAAQAERIAMDLRRQNLKGSVISVQIKTPQLVTVSRQTSLPHYTWLEHEIREVAIRLIEENWRTGDPIRAITVGVSRIYSGIFFRFFSLYRTM